jgi:hypothetical protein
MTPNPYVSKPTSKTNRISQGNILPNAYKDLVFEKFR